MRPGTAPWRPGAGPSTAPARTSLRRDFLQRLGQQPSRLVELAMDGQVFCVPEDRNDLLPSFRLALLEGGPHLADGLSREQQAPARVVEDLARELHLAS